MQRSLYLVLALFISAALLTTSCRKDSDNPVDGGKNKPTVTTTIMGIVSDEAGKGLSGVSVSAHGKTATTNQYGLFVIKDARVPQDRCFVRANSNGYFTGSRAEAPKAGGVTNMRLSMMRNTANYSVSSSMGGAVAISEGGSVQLPANAYVTGNGSAYSGTVKVAARWLNPVSPKFFGFFPGDFTATRTNGSETELYSYGVLNVELMTAGGEKLQLASGKKATLKYPIPSEMLAGAPAEMPLWYFDETIGMWKEDGKAVKQGSFYVGEVSHFTSWNCDIPTETGNIRGRVSCGNDPLTGAVVQVGQRMVITDEDGNYSCRVPAGITFTVNVDPAQNMGTGLPAPITAGPVAAQQTTTVDLVVSPCPAYVIGRLVDCNGDPTEGIVQIVGATSYGYTIAKNGEFRIRVASGTNLTANALGYNAGISEPQDIAPVDAGTTFDMGNIELCPQNTVTFLDINSDLSYITGSAFSPDGSLMAVGGYNLVKIFNVADGSVVQTLTIPVNGISAVRFSADGSKLLATNDSTMGTVANTYVWNTNTWQLINSIAGAGMAVFMPDGNSILGVNEANEVVQYNVNTGAVMNTFTVGGYQNHLIGVRANGTQFVLHNYNNNQRPRVVVWDMTSNSQALTFDYEERIYPMNTELSADGSVLFTVSWGQVVFHNMNTGAVISSAATGGDYYAVLALAPNGERYAGQVRDKSSLMPPAIYNANNGSMARLLPTAASVTYDRFMYGSGGAVLGGVYRMGSNPVTVRVWQLP